MNGFESALALIADALRLATRPPGYGIAVWVLAITFARFCIQTSLQRIPLLRLIGNSSSLAQMANRSNPTGASGRKGGESADKAHIKNRCYPSLKQLDADLQRGTNHYPLRKAEMENI
jgi:hypothetical protein